MDVGDAIRRGVGRGRRGAGVGERESRKGVWRGGIKGDEGKWCGGEGIEGKELRGGGGGGGGGGEYGRGGGEKVYCRRGWREEVWWRGGVVGYEHH